MRRNSRLSRKFEKESKKNIVLSLLGIALIIFLMLKVGIPLLTNFALFIANSKNETITQNSIDYVAPPQLDPIPSATGSAKLKVNGKVLEASQIKLYLNDSLIDETSSDKNGKFSFDITLNKGENKIYAKSKIGNKTSSYSDEYTVLYLDKSPNLTIYSPSDGQTINGDQKSVNVSGATDPNVKITINGLWAILDSNNKFSYDLPLKDGANEIKIEAIDPAGNKTEKILNVTYSH